MLTPGSRCKRVHSQLMRPALLIAGLAVSLGAAAADDPTAPAASATPAARTHSHMPEALRGSIARIAIVGGPNPTEEEITGTYEEVAPGLYGGIAEGSRLGTPSAQVGMITVSFPVPLLTLPGAIFGGVSGKAQKDLQDFRDAMADDLAKADNQPLVNDRLALDVFGNLQGLPGLESRLFAPGVEIPDETDAVYYVSIAKLTFDVEDDEAILTASAEATLRQRSDGKTLYTQLVQYQDRDSLANWTRDDNALWRDYANFARHYLGRELAAEAFDRIELNHELVPRASGTIKAARKNDWQFTSKSATPTLAWNLDLLGSHGYGPWAEDIDETMIDYDVEVYDRKRLVYSQKRVPAPSHTLAVALEPCKTYWWSVRPSYRNGEDIHFGEWMRKSRKPGKHDVDGLTGRQASAAPAYIQDFATLELACR